jgi:hypothetical protein
MDSILINTFEGSGLCEGWVTLRRLFDPKPEAMFFGNLEIFQSNIQMEMGSA